MSQIDQKRKRMAVERYQTDLSLVKSVNKPKRSYTHRPSFQTKQSLREEIPELRAKVRSLTRNIRWYQSVCKEMPPWEQSESS